MKSRRRNNDSDGRARIRALSDYLLLQRRGNYDGDGKDRISALPDCLLLQILSHLNLKQAIQISILSTRWKNLWKHITFLSFNYRNSEAIESFTKFVSQFLSLRNDKTSLQALNFECRDFIKPHLLKRIMKYVFSHNVQQLHMTVACNIERFPLCNFSCHTLTSLRLTSCNQPFSPGTIFPNSLKLPALADLSLQFFVFAYRPNSEGDYAEPFSVFKSLHTLRIQYCEVFNELNLCEDNLFISSVSLVNLTISLPDLPYKFKLSTPNLCTFEFRGRPLQNLSGRNSNINSNFSYIKHVKIVLPFSDSVQNFPSILFNWLVELTLMESLTVSPTTLEILNEIPDSWKIDFPYLHNLKLLQIDTREYVSDGIGDFLLQNAPSAKKVIKRAR
ncbi:unnamed protein product [Lathyrus sativus]|nr:unnamed protein product [Lathyrus sativus]